MTAFDSSTRQEAADRVALAFKGIANNPEASVLAMPVEEMGFDHERLQNLTRLGRALGITPLKTLYDVAYVVFSDRENAGRFHLNYWDLAKDLKNLGLPDDIDGIESLAAFKASEFLFKCPVPNGLPPRMANAIRNQNITSLGGLVMKSERQMLRIPNFSYGSLDKLKETLEGLGLKLGMTPAEITRFEANPPAAFRDAFPDIHIEGRDEKDLAPSPSYDYETNDDPTTVAGHLLPPGAVYAFADKAAATQFAEATKAVFKSSEGSHVDNGEIDAAYHGAITRLPAQTSPGGKIYPVYLSDAALNMLAQPAQTATIQQELSQALKAHSARR